MYILKNLSSPALAVVLLLASTSNTSLAASVDVGTVFESVNIFNEEVFATEMFSVDQPGLFEVTLTDFGFPNPLAAAGINVSTATDSLGQLFTPGSFTFEADAGDYYVSYFATAEGLGQYGIQITPSAVPAPAAVWLFGSGLLGLAGFIRREHA